LFVPINLCLFVLINLCRCFAAGAGQVALEAKAAVQALRRELVMPKQNANSSSSSSPSSIFVMQSIKVRPD
jgi:hypothetical protein